MTTPHNLKIETDSLKSFHEQNPELDMLNFDFNDQEVIKNLKWGDENEAKKEPILHELKTHQRVLRVHSDPAVAQNLLDNGFDSAHKIANLPEHQFVRKYSQSLFSGEEKRAKEVHQNATEIKAKTKHLFANVHSMVSPHFRAMLVNNMDPELTDYFEHLPSYQDLFGGLNYCKCDHYSSIFSPAAYFLDIMRIVDEYITDPNTHKDDDNIPAQYQLENRRPDLFELPINAENTTETLPFLQIVNTILERRIALDLEVTTGTASAGGNTSITLATSASSTDDAYNSMTIRIIVGTGVGQTRTILSYTGNTRVAKVNKQWEINPDSTSQYTIANNSFQILATAPYPFNLPFNLPLVQIRSYFDSLKTRLSTIFAQFSAPVTGGTALGGTTNTITLASEDSGENDAYTNMQVKLIGETGAGQVRTITAYDGTTKQATVDEDWKIIPDNTTQYHIDNPLEAEREDLELSIEQYHNLITVQTTSQNVAPFYGYVDNPDSATLVERLSRVETFLNRTGLHWEQLNELLVQNLSQQELANNEADNFYINQTCEVNQTGEVLPYLQVGIDNSDPDNQFYEIKNLSLKRLDRLNRFIRLASQLNWSYADLNWALVSINASEIDEQAIEVLAQIKRLQKASALAVDMLCSLWYDMKTIGKGDGPYPQDLFDRIFNNPALLEGQDPYTSIKPIPFDPDRPLTWTINSSTTGGQNAVIRGRLLGALSVSDNDLTTLGNYVQSLLGNTGHSLDLTVTNLTWLYRLAKDAAIFSLTVDEYLVLLGLMYYPDDSYLSPPPGSLNPTVSKVIAQQAKVEWLKSTNLTVYEMLYILKGERSNYFNQGYETSSIAPFLENLATTSENARVTPNDLIFGDIDAVQCEQTFNTLIQQAFLTDIGIVLNNPNYQESAEQFPLTGSSFQTTDINLDESQQVYEELQQSYPPILIERDASSATLSRSFNKNTNLGFLFASDDNADNKINQVRAFLLMTKEHINITEFSFLFPLAEDSFITTNINSEASQRVFEELQQPPDNSSAIIDSSGYLSATFTKRSSLDFLFVSKGSGQKKNITDYDGSTKIATIGSGWTTIPDDTSLYLVINAANQGTAQEGTETSITLDASASPSDHEYEGMSIEITGGTGHGQTNTIVTYDGTSKVATVFSPWTTVPNNTSQYTIGVVVNQGTAQRGTDNTITLDDEASPTDDAYNGMTVAIIPDPEANVKRGEVKTILLSVRQNIKHTASVINNAQILQESNAVQGLADFLSTTPNMLVALVPFATGEDDVSNYVKELLTPIQSGQVPANIPPFIESLSRSWVLFDSLSFTIDEVQAVVDMPPRFNIKDTTNPTFENIESLSTFKSLTIAFNDQDNSLSAYFRLPVGTTDDCPNPKITALANLTHWEDQQICLLINQFWPPNQGTSEFDFNTVAGVEHLIQSFDIADKTGINVHSLLGVSTLSDLPLVKTNNQPILPNWQTFISIATAAPGAVQAKFDQEEFKKVDQVITGYLNEQKRYALLGFAIWVLNQNSSQEEFRSPSDLYQYLLIDVEMSGCDNTSYISQGVASVQLYMQRCRMMLEPGVTDLSNIPEVWWQWMSAYPVWAANRKIFLYPENYLNPALRKGQTPEFKKLADSLLQNQINQDSVAEAYTNYFHDVSELASLVHCDSYFCKVSKVGTNGSSGEEVDTLFVFGRTNTQPYTFFYRQLEKQTTWSAWLKIDLKINSMFLSPVYAFKKLFVFWVEMEEVSSSKVVDNNSIPMSSTVAKIKGSFLDTNGQWIEPQTIAANIVVDCNENYQLDPYANDALITTFFEPEPFDPQKIFYQKVYPLHLANVNDSNSNDTTPSFPKGENICIIYGSSRVFLNTPLEKIVLVSPNTNVPPYQYSFEENIYETNERYYDIVDPNADTSIAACYFLPNLKTICLDSSFNNVLLNVSIVNFLPGLDETKAPFYFPLLDKQKNDLQIRDYGPTINTYDRNVIMNNYHRDDYVQIPNDNSSFFSSDEFISKTLLLDSISGLTASVIMVKNFPGNFIFDNGQEAFMAVSQLHGIKTIAETTTGAYDYLPGSDSGSSFPTLGEFYISANPYLDHQLFNQLVFKFTRLSTNVINQLSRKLLIGGIDNVLTIESQETLELLFSRLSPNPNAVIAPTSDQLDFNGAYGLYFWEIFFHGPFLVADTLNTNKRFEDVKKWYEYIFNPTQQPDDGDLSDSNRFWRFLPFRTMTIPTLTEILTNPAQIDAYNNDPSDPDAIARLRIVAYAKAIVMKYIDNLIDWGDYLFAQDTRESITEATNLYVMADDLLGKRPESVGPCQEPTPRNFNEIKAENGGDIPQFLIYLENTLALAGSTTSAVGYSDVPFNDINGYFCVPENEELVAYWDRVADRLYKIRHCMNIQGQARSLSLFEPPIDPRQLILAARKGGNILPLISQLNAPVPNYRFQAMIERVKSLTSTLIQLGSSFLSVLEKNDGEALALLRSSQEKVLLNMTTFIKEEQIKEVEQLKLSLEESEKSATARLDYYTKLIKEGLSPAELKNIASMTTAMKFNVAAGVTRTLASVGYAVPQVGSPFAMTYGGQQIGSALSAASGAYEIGATVSNFAAQLSLTMAGYQRRDQEWQQQVVLAGFDQEQITYQIAANEIRQQISKRELKIHLTSIQQNEEMERFLKDKFTNQELYQWMITRLSTVYFQTYSLAFELAQIVQRCYQFELDSDQSFVNFGYWDSLHKGLLAGEGLMLALNQMEKAYIEKNTRRLEIEKTISLMQLNPKALSDLITKGECIFELSEKYLDNDYPGHYARKIKTVSISIPAVIGPYQNIKATLTQLSNQTVVKPDINAVKFLQGGSEATLPGPEVLRSNWWINQQIAISRGVDDTGLFELNFHDERYLPFEGTGAVSTWKLSLPKSTNLFDFEQLSDVIIKLGYTALDGGEKFRQDVVGLDTMKPYDGSYFFKLSQAFPQQWYAFLNTPATNKTQVMEFIVGNLVPPNIENAVLTGFYFNLRVPDGVNSTGTTNYITLKPNNVPAVNFNLDENSAYTQSFQTKRTMVTVEGEWTISFNLANTPADLMKSGQLDPDVIEEIVLVLYYEGTKNWS